MVLNLTELYLKGGLGVLPQKILHKLVQNPPILDTSNEFMGLHIVVHSCVTRRGFSLQ